MTARRSLALAVVLAAAPLALSAAPASAHGSMEDPVSRVYGCYREGPEAPKSAACKAAVAVSGPQAFYDWNGVNIADAGGRSREIIPDGELCSAGREQHRGLDLPRADWPATAVAPGPRTFRFAGTAPHRGTFELFVTREGYDPTQPLRWSDLSPAPIAKVTDPRMENGAYVLPATLPERSGRHLVYAIWQRSDSTEAFYSCSDVTFGGPAPAPATDAASAPAAPAAETPASHSPTPNAPAVQAGSSPATTLADTGGGSSVAPYTITGAAAVAVGAAALFTSLRRRSTPGRHRA
ncbi:lytic polysaccharide monooxygenase [Streptomyces sp. NPDC051940]|uniref:lytic polysaccharide monooxygenase auxiliary activity family 9 protein n=1 Tax=Streptomyces sp. NPDC051940 TaxID=3155675 RepID=UPI00343C08DB